VPNATVSDDALSVSVAESYIAVVSNGSDLGVVIGSTEINSTPETSELTAVLSSVISDMATWHEDKSTDGSLTGDINGVNTDFDLSFEPTADSEFVLLNGAFQTEGEDYTISEATITFLIAPPMNSIITVKYQTA
jgi:hypothetical protein